MIDVTQWLSSEDWDVTAALKPPIQEGIEMLKVPTRFQCLAGVAVAACLPSTALAQSSAPQTDEIVVTATKRGETLLSKTAVSANVVSGASLENREIRNPEDLKFSVPGVYIEQGSSTPRISIRGVGFDNFQLQAENGVAVYIDGVVMSRVQGQLGAFNDLERVEVLKGPQGSAFGRNATGGAINYITHKPEPGFSGQIAGTVGSFSRRKLSGVVNYGGEKVGIRISGFYDDDDGYITNLVTGNDHINDRKYRALRASLLLKPVDDLSINYVFNYFRQDDNGPGSAHQNATSADTAIFLGNLVGLTSLAPPGTPAALVGSKDYVVVNQFDPFTRVRNNFHTLTAEWDAGPVTLKSISGYADFSMRFRSDVAGPSAFSNGGLSSTIHNDIDSKQYSQELLLSGKGRIDWVVGAYFLREDAFESDAFNFNTALAVPPPLGLAGTGYTAPLVVSVDGSQRSDSLAFFGDSQFHATNKWRVNAGIRWTQDKKDVSSTGQSATSINSPGFPAVIFGPPTSGSVKFSRVTFQLGTEYDLTADLFGYLKFSRGYKAGGINVNQGTTYRPEILDAYEIGLKGNVLDGRVRFSAAAFYNSYRDIQQFISRIGDPVTQTVNAARARTIGFDGEVTVRLSDIFSVDSAITYMPTAKYLQFDAVDPLTSVATDLAGARLARSPRFTGVLGLNAKLPINEHLRFVGRVEGYRTSDIVFTPFAKVRPAFLSQNGYNVINASATFTINDKIDLRVYGRNLTDKFYRSGIFESVGFQFMEFGRPREIGGEIAIRF